MKQVLYVLTGIFTGFLLAGVLFLISRLPSGDTVALMPAPTKAPIIVDIRGAIPRPDVYDLPEGSRWRDAIELAGGLLTEADTSNLNLAKVLEDGELVFIPYQPGKEPTPEAGAEDGSTTQFNLPSEDDSAPTDETDDGSTNTDSGDLININTASLDELNTLPGIGPTTAQNIIDYRDENGDFFSIEEIMNVSGIGPATFENLQDLITVE